MVGKEKGGRVEFLVWEKMQSAAQSLYVLINFILLPCVIAHMEEIFYWNKGETIDSNICTVRT